MKCFIACAFGKPDVDEIQKECILPVLKEMKITPLRVDQYEHNDDIDDKIFELLDASNLAVVDLTYARPSAYYEAGYAFGQGKPVIYIARGDHFRQREDDPNGILRIHFDLQMKNIIGWTEPNESFCKRFRSRLRLVSRPLFARAKNDAKLEVERAVFRNTSVNNQLRMIAEKTIAILRAKGFRSEVARYTTDGTWPTLMCRQFDDVGQTVMCIARDTITSKLLRAVETQSSTLISKSLDPHLDREAHVFLISRGTVRDQILRKNLRLFSVSPDGSLVRDVARDGDKAESHVCVHVISAPKSLVEFADTFKGILTTSAIVDSK